MGRKSSLIEQNAKSGDILVLNGKDNSIYFNCLNGTLSNFINAKTNKPILDELDEIKTVSLTEIQGSIQNIKLESVVFSSQEPKSNKEMFFYNS
ncbi:MAG: hypothetical protein HRK26_04430 [Rickettsiaceae bacterium H1]|nr:hypothetical protein [Rickettsiaceae bacterium H1]